MSVGRMNRIEDLDGNPLWDKDNGILGNVTTSTGTQTLVEALDERASRGELEGALEGSLLKVAGIADLLERDDGTLLDGQSFIVSDSLRGGIFTYNEGSVVDDGGIYFASDNGSFERLLTSPVNACWYGAVPGQDSTAAIQACADATGQVGLPSVDESDAFIVDAWESTRPTSFFTIGGTSHVRMATPSVAYTPAFTFGHPGCVWPWELKLDGNNTSRTGILVEQVASDCCVDLDVKDITADLDSSNITAGLSVLAADRLKFNARGRDCRNTGHTNESIPRVVSYQDGGTGFISEFVQAIDSGSTAILLFGCQGTIGTVDVYDCEDNGIYSGMGCDIEIGTLNYRGSEEGLVVIGANSKVAVDNYNTSGDASYCIGVQDVEFVSVNNLRISQAPDGSTPRAIFRTRADNTLAEEVYIGTVSGYIVPERLVATEYGNIRVLTIANVSLTVAVVEGVWGNPATFANFRGVTQRAIVKEWEVTVLLADPGYSAGTLELRMPEDPSQISLYKNVNVYMLPSTESNRFRGSVTYPGVIKRGVSMQTNIGPYAREANLLDDVSHGIDSINQIPTSGYWNAGEDYALLGASSAPFRARCTASGTPGDWASY